MPNLSNFKIFAVTDMIQDIILIEGIAADYNSRESFIAPCCIPRFSLFYRIFDLLNGAVTEPCKS
jgi:hypothetical protein